MFGKLCTIGFGLTLDGGQFLFNLRRHGVVSALRRVRYEAPAMASRGGRGSMRYCSWCRDGEREGISLNV